MDTGFEGWHLYTACKLTFTHFYQPDDHRFERFGTGFVVQFPPGDPRFALVTNRHLVDVPWVKYSCPPRCFLKLSVVNRNCLGPTTPGQQGGTCHETAL
jgi:hypothetical protein